MNEMTKPAVDKATILLTTIGKWTWGNSNPKFEVEAEASTKPALIDGAFVLTPEDLTYSIGKSLDGQNYKHVPTAIPGTVKQHEVKVYTHPRNLTYLPAVSREPLVCKDTSGEFEVAVLVPATLPNGTLDPARTHSGVWRVMDPKQDILATPVPPLESFDFEYNEKKRLETIDDRGLDFKNAHKIFESPVYEIRADRDDERRWAVIGVIDGLSLFLVYCIRDRPRIISYRPASEDERTLYKQHVTRGGDPPEE